MRRILEFPSAGKTLMLVSHLPGLLHQVRTRALWLDCGQTTAEGNLDKVLAMIGKSRSSSLPGRKFTRKLEFFSQPCVFV